MKTLVKCLVVSIILVCCTFANNNVSALNHNVVNADNPVISNLAFPEDFDIVSAKQSLVSLHQSKLRKLSKEESNIRDSEINEILTDLSLPKTKDVNN